MTDPDPEFDNFLARHKPVFRRSTEDPFEPPEALDRIVLRQAREAIESDRPERVYSAPRWAMPVALAASLLLVFTVILHVGMASKAPVPEVTVQNISQQIEYPVVAPEPMAPMSTSRDDQGLPPGGFASDSEGTRYAPAPPPPPQVASSPASAEPAQQAGAARNRTAAGSEASSAPPTFRSDAKSWLAEIDRLRADGKAAEANTEMAEYKRQHRAYAGTPDR